MGLPFGPNEARQAEAAGERSEEREERRRRESSSREGYGPSASIVNWRKNDGKRKVRGDSSVGEIYITI